MDMRHTKTIYDPRLTILLNFGYFSYWLNCHLYTGWCGAGADHYEPLIAHPSSILSQEKVAVVLGGH